MEFFLFTTSRLGLGPTQPPIQWVLGTIALRVLHLGHETDHSLSSSAEVKNVQRSYTATPSTIHPHGVVLD